MFRLMIEVEKCDEERIQTFVLLPNASFDRRSMWILLGAMALAMGGISAIFAAMGCWAVLPFSGAEWLLLAGAFHVALKRNYIREVVTVGETTVRVEKGRDRPEQCIEFPRAWVALEQAASEARGHPGRLFLRLHGKRVEVGGFLPEGERETLARDLKAALREAGSHPPLTEFDIATEERAP
jgi:uncharacterized membrane protein